MRSAIAWEDASAEGARPGAAAASIAMTGRASWGRGAGSHMHSGTRGTKLQYLPTGILQYMYRTCTVPRMTFLYFMRHAVCS